MRTRLTAALAAAALAVPAAAAPLRPTRLEDIPVPPGATMEYVREGKSDLGDGRLLVVTQFLGTAPAAGDPLAALQALARFYEERFGVKCPRGSGHRGGIPDRPPEREAPITCEPIRDPSFQLGVGFRWAAKGPDGLAAWYVNVYFMAMKTDTHIRWAVVRMGTQSAADVKVPGEAELGMPAFPGATFDPTQSGTAPGMGWYRFTTAAAPETVARFYEGVLKTKVLCFGTETCTSGGSRKRGRVMITRKARSPTEIVIQPPER